MKEGPVISTIAALVGDPARANILTELMDGRALTASELSEVAGVTLATASSHLAKLREGGLLALEKQGRHRYFRISDADVAEVLEALMNVAERTGAKRVRTGPRDSELREARVCYDHLAGEKAVLMLTVFQARGFISPGDNMLVTDSGAAFFGLFGIDLAVLRRGRRPVCKCCLDWSERRPHLAGALGAALLTSMLGMGWVKRAGGRRIRFTALGEALMKREFHLE